MDLSSPEDHHKGHEEHAEFRMRASDGDPVQFQFVSHKLFFGGFWKSTVNSAIHLDGTADHAIGQIADFPPSCSSCPSWCSPSAPIAFWRIYFLTSAATQPPR
jgi:hypothetical protein